MPEKQIKYIHTIYIQYILINSQADPNKKKHIIEIKQKEIIKQKQENSKIKKVPEQVDQERSRAGIEIEDRTGKNLTRR